MFSNMKWKIGTNFFFVVVVVPEFVLLVFSNSPENFILLVIHLVLSVV